MIKTVLNGSVYNSVDYRAFDTSKIIDIHKYLVKKMFIRLLTKIVVNTSNHTKYVSLDNQKCEI